MEQGAEGIRKQTARGRQRRIEGAQADGERKGLGTTGEERVTGRWGERRTGE